MQASTVVGYANNQLREGFKMVGASFQSVGGSGIKLTSLAPVGYEDVEYFLTKSACGVNGEFQIKILNDGGGTAKDNDNYDKTWSFYRTYTARAKSPDVPAWQNDGRWVQDEPDTEITSENDVMFENGEGLWFYISPDAYMDGDVPANQYTLNNSGEALMDAANVPLREGFKGIVAPLSADVKLTTIKPIGYEDVEYFLTKSACGVNGEFQIKILNDGGGTAKDNDNYDKTWSFYRTYTARAKSPDVPAWQNDGRWVQDEPDTEITSENDVTFEMGEGLWFYISPDAYMDGDVPANQYSLSFPGIED